MKKIFVQFLYIVTLMFECCFEVGSQPLSQNESAYLYNSLTAPQVVVSGAGPAGLVTALAMSKKGYNVGICEKRQRFSRTNLVNVHVDGLRFLDTLGLRQEVLDIASVHRYHAYKVDGYSLEYQENRLSALGLGQEDVSQDWRNLYQGSSALSLRISDFQNVMAKKLLQRGIPIFKSCSLEKADILEGGLSVDLKIDECIYPLQPRFLIIAEGARSKSVEQWMGGWDVVPSSIRPYKESWSAENIDISCLDEELPAETCGAGFSGYHCISSSGVCSSSFDQLNIGIFHGGDGHHGTLSFTNTRYQKEKGQSDEVYAHKLAGILGRQGIQGSESVSHFEAQDKRAKIPVDSTGSIFVIGDAAFTSSPIAGLGFTLAISAFPAHLYQHIPDAVRLGDQEASSIVSGYCSFVDAIFDLWRAKSDANWIDLKNQMVKKNS